jgi:hypothetical protein
MTDNFQKSAHSLSNLQRLLNWTDTYSPEFRDSKIAHKDFQHAHLHIVKAIGKLAVLIEDRDHKSDAPIIKAEVEKYLADIVICALRMADVSPCGRLDLQKAVQDRMGVKMDVQFGEQP